MKALEDAISSLADKATASGEENKKLGEETPASEEEESETSLPAGRTGTPTHPGADLTERIGSLQTNLQSFRNALEEKEREGATISEEVHRMQDMSASLSVQLATVHDALEASQCTPVYSRGLQAAQLEVQLSEVLKYAYLLTTSFHT